MHLNFKYNVKFGKYYVETEEKGLNIGAKCGVILFE